MLSLGILFSHSKCLLFKVLWSTAEPLSKIDIMLPLCYLTQDSDLFQGDNHLQWWRNLATELHVFLIKVSFYFGSCHMHILDGTKCLSQNSIRKHYLAYLSSQIYCWMSDWYFFQLKIWYFRRISSLNSLMTKQSSIYKSIYSQYSSPFDLFASLRLTSSSLRRDLKA